MKKRLLAPLVVALVSLLAAAQPAFAQHVGATHYGSSSASCDAQTVYASSQLQNRVTYKLVYDDVLEKRWHTTYQTVTETVNKQVTRHRLPRRVQDLLPAGATHRLPRCGRGAVQTCLAHRHAQRDLHGMQARR